MCHASNPARHLIEVWRLVFLWMLELGIWSFSTPLTGKVASP